MYVYSRDSLPDGAHVGSDSGGASAQAPRVSASAGFGSPSADPTTKRIDLNDALIRHPQAAFVMRASGVGMRDAGIDSGDVLLVDRSLTAAHGNVVVAVLDGEMVCRRLWSQDGQDCVMKLQAAHPDFEDTVITDGVEMEMWGVVTHVIKQLVG